MTFGPFSGFGIRFKPEQTYEAKLGRLLAENHRLQYENWQLRLETLRLKAELNLHLYRRKK